MKRWRAAAFFLGLIVVSCGKRGQIVLPPPTPARVGAVQVGMASWYGHPYHGRTTSSGEIYDMRGLTAAHLTLPFDTTVRVTNLANNRSVDLRINDRGPFLKNRLIDVSQAAAEQLAMIGPGTARVRVEVVATPETTRSAARRPARGPSAKPAAACAQTRHGVQVGSFRDPENAGRALAELAGRYETARILLVESPGGPLYRVVVAAQDDLEARRALERLTAEGVDGFITRLPQNAACLTAGGA